MDGLGVGWCRSTQWITGFELPQVSPAPGTVVRRVPRRRGRVWTLGLVLLSAAGTALPARGDELVSSSYRLLGSHTNAGGSADLQSTADPSAIGRIGASIGQPGAIGFVGSLEDLTTTALGFWPIESGEVPSLDLDADQIQAFRDDDDDNDGLLDIVETDTGVFQSALDTGTSPIDADTDGDGFGDGEEVSQGSDPTDPASTPDPPPIPALSAAARMALVGALWLAALLTLRQLPHERLPTRIRLRAMP